MLDSCWWRKKRSGWSLKRSFTKPSEMAVPILNSSPMGNISLDKLPLEADFLDLLWFDSGVNFSGFLGEYQNTKYPFHFNSLPQESPLFSAQWWTCLPPASSSVTWQTIPVCWRSWRVHGSEEVFPWSDNPLKPCLHTISSSRRSCRRRFYQS